MVLVCKSHAPARVSSRKKPRYQNRGGSGNSDEESSSDDVGSALDSGTVSKRASRKRKTVAKVKTMAKKAKKAVREAARKASRKASRTVARTAAKKAVAAKKTAKTGALGKHKTEQNSVVSSIESAESILLRSCAAPLDSSVPSASMLDCTSASRAMSVSVTQLH